ncbi:MAG TPA: acyl-CoA dehydrogenase family protein [Gaiellaceae bacterium]|nr:acyl-CoA dehydrogenase family protein [Gaiellaceae bacterium]
MTVVLAPEQEELRQAVRTLMEERVAPRAAEIDAAGEFPADVRRLFAEHDIFAAVVPAEYGGIDGTVLTLTTVCEEITRVCANSGMVLGNQSLGAGPIALYGSDDQKEALLPRLASGELLCAFALSEPGAGSDAASLTTRARRDGDDWLISGRKNFITHANVADVITVFARVDGSDETVALLVTKDEPGWLVDRIEHKMGLRGSPTCSVVLEDVRVPDSARLGEVGDGLRVALGTLDKGRIMTASMALGIAQGAFELALEYAQEREQFGRPIAEFQAVQFMLADMDTDLQATRALVRSAASSYDAGDPAITRISAATKLFATDMVNRVTSTALQVLGGYGFIVEYGVERRMRDARVFAIFEGTNEIQRIVIARELLRGRR